MTRQSASRCFGTLAAAILLLVSSRAFADNYWDDWTRKPDDMPTPTQVGDPYIKSETTSGPGGRDYIETYFTDPQGQVWVTVVEDSVNKGTFLTTLESLPDSSYFPPTWEPIPPDVLNAIPSSAPEPETMALMLLGLGALGVIVRRRSRSARAAPGVS